MTTIFEEWRFDVVADDRVTVDVCWCYMMAAAHELGPDFRMLRCTLFIAGRRTLDLMKLGQQLLGDKLGSNGGGLMSALSSLSGSGGSNSLDLGGIVKNLQAGGLSQQVQSWLGDGQNESVSNEQLRSALGQQKVNEAAASMGTDENTALDQLRDALPSLLDNASSGGSLNGQSGGVGGAVDMAKGLFK